MIICSKCGMQNPLGRLYCIKCRAKLDLANVEKDDILKEEPSSVKRRTKLFFILLILFLGLTIIVLSLWPSMPPPHRYVPQEAQIAARKIELLERGFSAQQMFSEAEINSFLASLKGGALPVKLSVQIYPDALIVNMVKVTGRVELFGKKIGPFTFTKKLLFNLDKDIGKLKLSGGKVGYLPLPGAMAKIIVPSFKEAMKVAWKDVGFLNRFVIVKMSDKTIVVKIQN